MAHIYSITCYSPQHAAGQHLRLCGQRLRNRLLTVNTHRRVVLLVHNTLHRVAAGGAILAERPGRIVVAGADRLLVGLLVRQRRFRHRLHVAAVARVAGRRTGNRAGGRHRWAPRAAAALHRQLEAVARIDDQILGVLVAHIVRLHLVHLDEGVAHLQASLVSDAAHVHLRVMKPLNRMC